jgi:DNA-binding NtrC family response regulator
MRLLIIGDLEGQIAAASRIARARGAKVAQVASIEAALTALRAGQGADLALIEARDDVARLVTWLEAERFSLPVVACGVKADSASAVRAIRAGAQEYLPLPPDEELIAAVLEAVAGESHDMIAESPAMKRAVALAAQVAGSDASILITGESGTGKEVVAHFIHRKSKRAQGNFISINCAAIPEALLESELFGHEKGAFTGAVARRIGKFEEANDGTLLLDEISEMDVRLQAKLLRAIQEREIDRVGGSKPVKVNLRILATSNRDLQAEVKKGAFRQDLYFRLNVIHLNLPPLRERREDLVPLSEHFIDKYARINDVPRRNLSKEALRKMQHHSWPGNVRELENLLHRAVLIATGAEIGAEAIILPDMPQNEEGDAVKTASRVGRTVESVERELIIDTLDHCLGNRTNAASILGISIRTLRNKLKQYQEEGRLKPELSRDAG